MKHAHRTKGNALLLFLLLIIPVFAIAENKIVPTALQKPPEQVQIDSLLILSEAFAPENPDTALYFARQAEKTKNSNTPGLYKRLARAVADAYYYKNQFDSAIVYYQASADAEEAQNGKMTDYYAKRINDVAFCYHRKGYYEMAIKNYSAALTILRVTNNQDEISSTLSNMGTDYFMLGKFVKSIDYFEQTLAIDEKNGNPYYLSVTYNNIGKVYHAWNKHERALVYFALAKQFAVKAGILRMEETALSNMGMVYFDMDSLNKALDLLDSAMQMSLKSGNKFKVAIRENELAKIWAAKGDITKAIGYANSALAFFEENGMLESQSIALHDLGDFYLQADDFSRAEKSYLESLGICSQTGNVHQSMLSTKGLSMLYEQWDKPKKALEYFKQYEALHTEIFNEENHRQLAEFEIKYQSREKEIENQMLKSENNEKQNRLVYLIIMLVVMLLLIIILFYSIRLKSKSLRQQKAFTEFETKAHEKEKQHYEDKVFAERQINRLQLEQFKANIEHKNQRLASSTLNLIQKNEFLLALKNKLVNNGQDAELTKKEIVSLINQNIDVDQNWKKFRYEFNQSHPDFLDKLTSRFPELSETYIQLCAFLRIGLSSKEIAQLQNVSDSAVNKNRQRLRKKLELEAEADLGEFLKKLG